MIVRARDLQPGDLIVRTGETVIRIFSDQLTPKGGMNIVLSKGKKVRCANWSRKSTPLLIERATKGEFSARAD